MDFLNKSIAQLSDLFRSMTPGARITAGLLLAVVVVSFGYLFQHASAGPDAFLFGGEALSDDEINAVEGAIAADGLSGFVREGNRIRVPAAQKAEYLAAVVDGGAMPRNANTILANALDNGKWHESREATSQRLKIATQQTLGEIVRAMRWVEEAFVLCGEQQSGGGNRLGKSVQQTASVTVRPIAGESLDPRREKMLKQFVAHAVGMSVDNVAVINLGDGSGDGGEADMFPEWFDDPYYRTKVAFEMQKRRSIMNALRDIPGVRVEVSAELDNMMVEETSSVKPDKNAVDRRETTTTEKSIQAVADPEGRPGPTSQGPYRQVGAANTQAQARNKNETTSDTSDVEKVVGIEEIITKRHGLTPKKVWATVTIPGRYIETIWKERNKTAKEPPKPQELEIVRTDVVTNVENIANTLLQIEPVQGQDTYKFVSVVVLDSLPAPTIESPSIASTALALTDRYWSTLAMLGVAVFSLLVLRSVVRGGPSGEAAIAGAAAPALTLHADEPTAAQDENKDADETSDRPRLRLKKGKTLKDDLVEIVHDDPDAAAEILRSWIGKAS